MRKIFLPVMISVLLMACGKGEEEAQVADNTNGGADEHAVEGGDQKDNTGGNEEQSGKDEKANGDSGLKPMPGGRRRPKPTNLNKPTPPSPVPTPGNGTVVPPVPALEDNQTAVTAPPIEPTAGNGTSTLVPKTTATAADLIGSWRQQAGDYTYVIRYSGGGSGTVKIIKGKQTIDRLITWEVDGDSYTQVGLNKETGGKDTIKGIFAIQDDQLTLTLGDEAFVLRRVKR